MEPTVDVDAVTLRASQYWMEDGLVELMLGLLICGQFGVYMAAGALPRGPITDFVSTFGAQAFCLAITLSIFGGFKKLKARITFPRTGYVALPKPSRTRRVAMITLVPLAGVAMALAIPLVPGSYEVWLGRLASPAAAMLLAACFIGGGLQYKQPSMLWEGLLTLLFAPFLSLLTNLSGMKAVGLLMITVGVSMAIIGALRLRSFLKAHPRPQETAA